MVCSTANKMLYDHLHDPPTAHGPAHLLGFLPNDKHGIYGNVMELIWCCPFSAADGFIDSIF